MGPCFVGGLQWCYHGLMMIPNWDTIAWLLGASSKQTISRSHTLKIAMVESCKSGLVSGEAHLM